MRGAFGVFVSCSVIVLAGCADDPASTLRPSSQTPTVTTPEQTTQPATASPAELACASTKQATTIATAGARDVRLAGTAVFYQVGTQVIRTLKDGSGTTNVYASPDLVRSYVDTTALVLIESTPNTTNATLRVVARTAPKAAEEGAPAPVAPSFPEFPKAEGDATVGVTAATAFHAAGTRVFASDATAFYLLADTDQGDAIVKVDKANPATQTTIVAGANVVRESPQIANGSVWYVQDGQRVFKATLGDGDAAPGAPSEVFGIGYASCSLAVGETAAFCSVGSAVERRDLSGANPKTILDETKSKAQARFGATQSLDGRLFVRSAEPDAKVKHVIRELQPSVTGTEETLLACGRSMVTELAVDGTHVAWVEESGGVFVTAR